MARLTRDTFKAERCTTRGQPARVESHLSPPAAPMKPETIARRNMFSVSSISGTCKLNEFQSLLGP
jgi:hypothetical protein